MPIKLNGATNGSVELDVPAAVGSDLQLTLPATAGEVVVKATDGSVDLGSVDIDSSGNVGIGTSSVDFSAFGSNTGGVAIEDIGGTNTGLKIGDGSNDNYLVAAGNGSFYQSHYGSGSMIFGVGNGTGTERMRINSSGAIFFPNVYTFTTASAANVTIFSGGEINRSTSSSKYKTDIETLEDSYADALLNCRPVWYRSTCKSDNPDYGWWGFIAEEVAEIDPRLVHWKTVEVTYDEKGSAIETPCDPEPEGVAYDRFVPHLLNLIKRQKEQIEAQSTAIAALEARLTTLEGGTAQ